MIIQNGNEEIHVYSFKDLRKYYNSLINMLTIEEITKSDEFINEKDKMNFILSKGITKIVLSIHMKCKPKEIIMKKNKYGKPYIDRGKLFFNISHTKEVIAIGLSPKDIGIDIEKLKYIKDIDLLIDKTVGKGKYNELKIQMSKKDINNYFIEDWVVKESYLKCLGIGIRKPISDINYSIYFKNNNYELVKHEKEVYTKKIKLNNRYILCYSIYCGK